MLTVYTNINIYQNVEGTNTLGHSNMSRVTRFRGGSRAAATSKMESFVIIVNGWEPLTIITKNSILDVATVLDPALRLKFYTEIYCSSVSLVSTLDMLLPV